jgi:hypothetical protein
MRELDQATRAALSPGPQLDYQNLRTVNSLKQSLDELMSTIILNNVVRIGFYEWSRHMITLAATDGVFGESNPFLEQDTEAAFW